MHWHGVHWRPCDCPVSRSTGTRARSKARIRWRRTSIARRVPRLARRAPSRDMEGDSATGFGLWPTAARKPSSPIRLRQRAGIAVRHGRPRPNDRPRRGRRRSGDQGAPAHAAAARGTTPGLFRAGSGIGPLPALPSTRRWRRTGSRTSVAIKRYRSRRPTGVGPTHRAPGKSPRAPRSSVLLTRLYAPSGDVAEPAYAARTSHWAASMKRETGLRGCIKRLGIAGTTF
jgi:hypothetical protein